MRAPHLTTGCRSAWFPSSPGTACVARNLFITPADEELADHDPEFTIVQVPGFKALPETDGTNSETVVLLDFARRLVLIGGTAYAGECKKSVFTIMNYLMPARDVLPMHCSVNMGADGRPAVFFGLSRHRQDHALGRPAQDAARRRRARLEPGRPVQFRGGLLRQGDSIVGERRARNPCHDADVRHRARERRDGSRLPCPRSRRRHPYGEHQRSLSAGLHSECQWDRRYRPPGQYRHADRGRLRRAATGLRDSRPNRRSITSSPAIRPRSPAPSGTSARSRRPPSRPASARPSCRAGRPPMRASCANGSK